MNYIGCDMEDDMESAHLWHAHGRHILRNGDGRQREGNRNGPTPSQSGRARHQPSKPIAVAVVQRPTVTIG